MKRKLLVAVSMKRKLPSDAKSRFGKEFFGKLCELFQSVEQDACDRLRQMHDEVINFYIFHIFFKIFFTKTVIGKLF